MGWADHYVSVIDFFGAWGLLLASEALLCLSSETALFSLLVAIALISLGTLPLKSVGFVPKISSFVRSGVSLLLVFPAVRSEATLAAIATIAAIAFSLPSIIVELSLVLRPLESASLFLPLLSWLGKLDVDHFIANSFAIAGTHGLLRL